MQTRLGPWLRVFCSCSPPSITVPNMQREAIQDNRAGGTATAVAIKAVAPTPRPVPTVEESREDEKIAVDWPTRIALTLAVLGVLAFGTVLPFWFIQLAQQAAHMM